MNEYGVFFGGDKTEKGKTEALGENLSQCDSLHHKSLA
jgi:hypothetical protein